MRLSQILLNLINNAVKFTQEGYVRLSVKAIKGTSWVKVTVQDTGIGINEKDMNKLFEMFSHIEFKSRSVMNPSGVGLGLNIACNLASLLGPQRRKGIMVESAPQKGSTFSFIIENKSSELQNGSIENKTSLEDPLLIPIDLEVGLESPLDVTPLTRWTLQTTKMHSQPNQSPKAMCECPRVLIVDDNLFNIMAYEVILKPLGIKSDSAYNGKSALEKLLERTKSPCGCNCKFYEMIFMDKEMPEMNGTEAVREIRRLQTLNTLPDVKIIGCTAHKDKEEVDEFLESGIDQCIHKPISKTMIQDLLS